MKLRAGLLAMILVCLCVVMCGIASADSGTLDGMSWDLTDGVLTLGAAGETQIFQSGVTDENSYYYWPWDNSRNSIFLVKCAGNIEMHGSLQEMFNDCSAIVELDMSGWDVSHVNSMAWLFGSCSSLRSLDVSNFNTGNVTDMYGMFWDCSGLTSLDVSGWNTSNVTDMHGMFLGCSNLTLLDVSRWNTGNVADMSMMFAECRSIPSLNVSSWNVSGVHTRDPRIAQWMNDGLARMFEGCTALTSIDVSSWDVSNVSYFSQMFNKCIHLRSVDVSRWDISNAISINGMFQDCRSLEVLDISHWDLRNVTDTSYFLHGCISLKLLDLSNVYLRDAAHTYNMYGDDTPSAMGTYALNEVILGTHNPFVGGGGQDGDERTNLPFPPEGTIGLKYYNGSWIRKDGAYGPYNSQELTANYTSEMAGTWVWYSPTNYEMDFVSSDAHATGSMDPLFLHSSMTFALPKNEFQMDGFVFDHWKDSKGRTYSDEESVPKGRYVAGNVITMTAYFRPLSEDPTEVGYIVRFTSELDGVSGEMSDIYAMPHQILSLPANQFQKVGYTFAHWVDGDGNVYADGAKIPAFAYVTGDVVELTAVFTEVPEYTIDFDSSLAETAGYMPRITASYHEDVILPVNRLYAFGYEFDHWEDADGRMYADQAVIPANTYYAEDQVVLTAHFKKNDFSVQMTDGVFEFTLHGNETALFDNLPATMEYNVYEETPDGWRLMISSNSHGYIQPVAGNSAEFVNSNFPTYVETQLRGLKLLDHVLAKNGSFDFDLLDADGNVLQTVTVQENGEIVFAPLRYTVDDVGEYTYIIREREPQTYAAVTGNPVYSHTDNVDNDGKQLDLIDHSRDGNVQTVYSHTDNIDDNGIKQSDYTSYWYYDKVATIPGATSLHVKVTYTNPRGHFKVWTNQYRSGTPYKSYSYQTDKDQEFLYDEFDVPGDVISIEYYSYAYSASSGYYPDGPYSDMVNYGYYMEVTANEYFRSDAHRNDGSRISDYVSYAYYPNTVTVPGASMLRVKLKYTVPRGYFYVWEGTHNEVYTRSWSASCNTGSSGTGNPYKRYEYQSDKEQEFLMDEFVVNGDSLSVLYYSFAYSPSSGYYPNGPYSDMVNYGYYMEITPYFVDGSGDPSMVYDSHEEVVNVKVSGEAVDIPVVKYSHSPNVYDDGRQNGRYDSKFQKTEVVTIPGATSLHVTLTYGLGNEDYVQVWGGSYPTYVANRNDHLPIYADHTSSWSTKEYNFNGDSVTFGFSASQYSKGGDGYGYYAIVTGNIRRAPDLSVATMYDEDGALFENATKPGTIALAKFSANDYVPNVGFMYEIAFFDDDHQTVDVGDVFYHPYDGSYEDLIPSIEPKSNYVLHVVQMYGDQYIITDKFYVAGDEFSIDKMGHKSTKFDVVQGSDWLQFHAEDGRFTGIMPDQDISVRIQYWDDAPTIDKDIWVNSVLPQLYNSRVTSLVRGVPANTSSMIKIDDGTTGYNVYFCVDNCKAYWWSDSDIVYLPEDCSYMFKNCCASEINFTGMDTSNVTNMDYMFYACSYLTFADLSGFDVSNVATMRGIFSYCTRLASLNLSGWDTNNVTIMGSMFSGCKGFTAETLSETLQQLDTHSVVDMSYMFANCISFATLNVPKLDTSNVTDMHGMFEDCGILESLDLSALDVSSVQNMSNMFNDCVALKSLNTSGWNVSSVENMSGLFSGSGLESFDFSDWNTISVTNMSSMFSNCNGLTSLDLSGLDTGNVINMYGMFSSCTNLTDLDLSGWDTSNVTNIGYMFKGCSHLAVIDCSKIKTNSVTYMSHMFDGCYVLNVIDVSEWDTSNVTDMSFMFANCTNLSDLDLASFDTRKVTTMQSMFNGCQHLRILDLSFFDTKSVTKFDDMFTDCGVQQVTLGEKNPFVGRRSNVVISLPIPKTADQKWYYENDTFGPFTSDELRANYNGMTMAGVWSWSFDEDGRVIIDEGLWNKIVCRTGLNDHGGSLTNATSFRRNTSYMSADELPVSAVPIDKGLSTKSVYFWMDGTDAYWWSDADVVYFPTDCHRMFAGCSNLVSVDLSGINTSDVINMYQMFYICSALESLDLSGWDTSNVTNMEDMFYACRHLTSLNVSHFDTHNVTTMVHMFYYCENLVSLDLSGWNTDNVTSLAGMFYDCNGLMSLNLHGFSTNNVSSVSSMFGKCDNLEFIDLSGFDMAKVPEDTYRYTVNHSLWTCPKLQRIVIGSNDPFGSKCVDLGIWRNRSYSDECYGWSYLRTLYANGEGENLAGIWERNTVLPFIDHNIWTEKVNTSNSSLNFHSITTFGRSRAYSGVNDLPEGAIKIDDGTTEYSVYCWVEGTNAYWWSDADIVYLPVNRLEMFHYCEQLVDCSFDGLDTRFVADMTFMFADCRKLVSLDVSSFDTSNTLRMPLMFDGCYALESLDLSHFDTSNVTDMGSMFYDCYNLKSLEIGSWDVSKVSDMGSMFRGCSRLESVDLSEWHGKPTTMYYMFYGCRSLISLDMSKFDVSNVSSFSHIFSSCSSLTTLNLSGWNTGNVTTMNGVFSGCKSLTSLDVSGWDTSNVTGMSDMFYNCNQISVLDLSDWNTGNVSSSDYMFTGTLGLRKVILGRQTTFKKGSNNGIGLLLDPSKFENDGVQYSGKWIREDAVYGPYTPEELRDNYTSEMAGSWICDISRVYDTHLWTEDWFAMANNDAISLKTAKGFKRSYDYKTVDELPENAVFVGGFLWSTTAYAWRQDDIVYMWSDARSIGFDHDMSEFFADCASLTFVDLSGFDCEVVHDIHGLFRGCSQLQAVIWPETFGGIENASAVFADCSSLQHVVLPSLISNYSSEKLNLGTMFYGCTQLIDVDVSNVDANIASTTGMFYGCSNLKTVFANSTWALPEDTASAQMFVGCTKLVGGAGTVFDDSHTDGAYARIDALPDAPGYFTQVAAP